METLIRQLNKDIQRYEDKIKTEQTVVMRRYYAGIIDGLLLALDRLEALNGLL